MRHIYKLALTVFFIGAGLMPLDLAAQDFTTCTVEDAECLVVGLDGENNPIPNALRNTIANDTLNGARKNLDRVYVLQSGATYAVVDEILNNGFHLRIRTQTEAEAGESFFGPARIQLFTDEEGNSAGRLMTVQGDLTLDNVFVTGRHDAGGTGNYLPIRVSSDGARIVIKNSIFEQSDFSLFGFDSPNNKVYIYDSMFRNHINRTQQWEGRGIRFEAGADTLVVENTSFLNIGMTILQSEAAPINYTRFVHNTVINVGRIFNAGNFWREAYVANNLFINHYWHGEGDADQTPDREYPYTGFFTIAPIGPGAGFTDAGRRVVYANNAHWRDPQFATYYSDSINAQPIFNSQADSMFNTFSSAEGLGSMYRANNWEGTDPNMVVYHTAPDLNSDFPATEISLEDLVPTMIANMRDLRENRQSPFTDWTWDPGRNPEPATYSVQSILPQYLNPGDFSYTESTYLTAGSDGLPLGNLNYHDGARADWESNKSSYVSDIEMLAGEIVVIDAVVNGYEAEWGELSDGAESSTYDGFVEYYIESAGYVEWKFTLDATADVDSIGIEVRSNDAVRGANIFINDGTTNTQLSNDVTGSSFGEIRFYNLGGNTYPEEGNVIAVDTMNAASQTALTGLQAGTEYTVRWEPGWGYYTTAGLVFYADGDTLVDMTGSKASDFAQVTPSAGDGATGWVPSLLRSVDLGTGGTISFSFDNDGEGFQAGDYFAEVFYENSGSANVPTVTANGGSVGVFSGTGFEESPGETSSFTTDHFQLESAGNIDMTITGSDAKVDYVIVFYQKGGVINDIEGNDDPYSFKLSQNYPNPFNPTTNINFTIPSAQDVQLTVYNLLGQRVATLVDGRMNSGNHTVRFDARSLASGVYFYQLKAGDMLLNKKMTLIK